MTKARSEENLDFATLRIFLETAVDGNMSRAARTLGMSQPAISQTIQRLEVLFHVPLFDRSSRPIRLTPAGRTLQTRSLSLLRQLNALSDDVRLTLTGHPLDINIASSDSFSGAVLPYLIDDLFNSSENLSLYTGGSPKVNRLFLAGDADIVISTQQIPDREDIVSYRSLTESYVVVTPKSIKNKLTSLSDINYLNEKLPIIGYNDESLDRIQIGRVLRQCGIHPSRKIEADTNLSVLSFVANNLGWTIMTPLALWTAKDLASRVSIHDVPGVRATRTFFVMYSDPLYANMAKTLHAKCHDAIVGPLKEQMSQLFPEILKYISPN